MPMDIREGNVVRKSDRQICFEKPAKIDNETHATLNVCILFYLSTCISVTMNLTVTAVCKLHPVHVLAMITV